MTTRKAAKQQEAGMNLGVALVQATLRPADLNLQARLLAAELNVEFWRQRAENSGMPVTARVAIARMAKPFAQRVSDLLETDDEPSVVH